MSNQDEKGFGNADPALRTWAEQLFAPRDEELRVVLARSDAAGLPRIAVGPMDGLILEVLCRALAPRKVVEIGALGGYSALCLLRGMPSDGVLHTFEFQEKHAAVVRETFAKSPYAGRAHVHVGPALERLREIEAEGPFDLVFIDADKPGYPAYLAWAEEHLRVGGTVLADNAFGWGGVAKAHAGEREDRVAGLRAFNERLARGGRFRATMIPTGEGLAMGVKVR